VVGEPLDLLSGLLGVAVLEGHHDPCMQLPTAVAQQAAIRHFVRQRVLEVVLGIGEETRLVEEFRGL
jgi:hypothetical protein